MVDDHISSGSAPAHLALGVQVPRVEEQDCSGKVQSQSGAFSGETFQPLDQPRGSPRPPHQPDEAIWMGLGVSGLSLPQDWSKGPFWPRRENSFHCDHLDKETQCRISLRIVQGS